MLRTCHDHRQGNDRTKVQQGKRTLFYFKCRQQNNKQQNEREAL